VAAGRLGAEAHFISRIGRDTFGDMAMQIWQDAGVRTEAVVRGEAATGAAFIYVDTASGDNAIIVSSGAAGLLTQADVEMQSDIITGAAVFVTQLEQPMDVALRGLELARAGGALTLLNPAPAAELPSGMLALCDYLTPNETEAEALTGVAVTDLDSARAAGDALLAQGVSRAAVLTLGAQGALFHARDRSVHVPALSAGPVVETTGAGDAFNGGFATALAEGVDPVEAARFACAVAALSVTRPGAAASMPTRAEVEALMSG